MGNNVESRGSAQVTGIALLVAIIGSILFFTALPASAHHPELVNTDATCTALGIQVDFTSQTWAFSPAEEGGSVNGGLHNNLEVQIDLNDGAGPRDLLDPVLQGSITSGESSVVAGNGEYADPTRTFSGTFTAPVGTDSITVRVTAIGVWGSNIGGGEVATQTIDLPDETTCSAPSANSAYQCVGGSGLATITVSNPTFYGVEFVVTVTDSNGGVSTQTFSDVNSASGPEQAVFAELASGAYSVSVTVEGDPISIGGDAADATLECDAAVGDRAWQDFNRNGVQDSGEPDQPVSAVTLSNGAVDSDGNGAYLFDGLNPDADYTVTFADVAGLVRAPRDVGDDSADSDADASGIAVVGDLEPGETDLTIDAGYWLAPPAPVCISGDVVWNNTLDLANVSGSFGTPATGLRFVNGRTDTFTLPGPLPAEFSGAVTVTSIEAVSWDGYWGRTTTSAQADETWRVVFTNNGTQVGASGFTGDVADGVYTAGWSGLLDLGSGLVLPNGADAIVLEHSSVSLVTSSPDSVVPVAVCISTSPVPGSIGDRVWFDDNGDGGQDAGETGINGVTVRLFDSNGELASDVTANDGLYLFENLAPGDYTVVVDDSTLPAGDLVQTFDLDGLLDHSSVEGLAANEHNRDHDFGYQRVGAIGDRVWLDISNDGIQDTGEAGINDVTVRLLDSNGAEIDSAITAGDGDYLFTGLAAGTYTVVVEDSTLPAGLTQTFDADGLTTPHRSTHPLGAGETNLDQDFGYVLPLASLGDTVWFDADADGLRDGDEPGIPGVTVTLFVAGDDEVDSVVTGAAGDYLFIDLDPNVDYVVAFSLLGGAFTAPDVGGDDAIDSDADPTTGLSHVVDLAPGEHDPTIDAGVVALTPDVDIEKDTNGEDADEPTGPTLEVGTTVTWTYVITNPGDYDLTNVVVTDDQGVLPVRDDSTDIGGDDILSIGESWTYTATGVAVAGQYANLGSVVGDPIVDDYPATDPFGDPVPPVKDDDPSHYLGFEPGEAAIDLEKSTNGFDADSADPAVNPIPEIAVGGEVTWTYDVTNTSGDIWLSNIVVTDDILGEICVIDGPLEPLGTAQCEAEGIATAGGYENLGSVIGTPTDEQGNRATNPDGTEIPEPFDDDPSHYVGLELASLGDRVWFDANADGLQADGEPGEAGVEVVLWAATEDGLPGTELASTTTDANGFYRFDDLDPNVDYIVQFLAGPLTSLDAGADDLDSDADPFTGFTSVIELAAGEYNDTIDAGLLPGSIGDRVWLDVDGDGIQGDDEVGIEGVTVNLTNADCDIISTTTTDANGNYLFTGLGAGEYRVQVIAPDGFAISPQEQGDDEATDSDIDDDGKTDVVTLERGENNLTVDAGLTELGSIGDFVFFDLDGDGIASDDASPVPDVVVNLLDADSEQIATTVTDDNGLYLFGGLEAGTYIVEFVEVQFFPFTSQGDGDDAEHDSDADPTTGLTGAIDLGPGQHRRDIDAGVIGLNTIGNYAWFDANRNGLQDAGESGFEGLVLDLVAAGPNQVLDSTSQAPRAYADGEALTDDGDRTIRGVAVAAAEAAGAAGRDGVSAGLVSDDYVLATATTDANGQYIFPALLPGSYLVCVRLESLPNGFELTTQNVQNSRIDHLDSDIQSEAGCTYPLLFNTSGIDFTIDIGVVASAKVLTQDPPEPLAFTGASSLQLALFAMLLFGSGALMLLVARRRKVQFD